MDNILLRAYKGTTDGRNLWRRNLQGPLPRIYQKFGKSLNLLYIDACELADPVLWGDVTEDALFLGLQEQVSESGRGNG